MVDYKRRLWLNCLPERGSIRETSNKDDMANKNVEHHLASRQ